MISIANWKEGWGLEKQHWGRDLAAARGRVTLTCLAFNTAQVYRLQAGQRLATVAIRRLRRCRERELGTAPAVIYLAGCYGVFALEDLLSLLGTPARESLLPVYPRRYLLQMLPLKPYLQLSVWQGECLTIPLSHAIVALFKGA